MSNDHPDARQERIDATARAIFAASLRTEGFALSTCYSGGASPGAWLDADIDAADPFAGVKEVKGRIVPAEDA